VRGISYTRQVPSVLDQHVLKSTSSADQRDVPLARCAHDLMGCIRIAVWAARPNDHCRPRVGEPGGITNLVGGNDSDIDGNPSALRRMSERSQGRAVEPVICRQIYQHRDGDGAHR
jgi:hypothetical protein